MAIIIPFITQYHGKGLEKLKKEFNQLEGIGAKTGFILKKSFLPATAALGGLAAAGFEVGNALLDMASAAAEDQKSTMEMTRTLKTFAKATSSQIALTQDYITKVQMATGYADDRLRPAFSRLVRSTKDVAEAQRLLNLSLDIAGATGKPLEQVVNALGKAYDGSNGALMKLGLGFDKATLKGMEFADIQDYLEKKFKGGAAAAADTFQGKINRLNQRFSEFKESIGTLILPLLETLADKAIKVADAFTKNGIGGALKTLQDDAPGFYNFIRVTYNLLSSIGDAFYNMGQVAKFAWDAAFHPWRAKLPKLGYWMPTWDELMASTAGGQGIPAPLPTIPGKGGAPGPAIPQGGTAYTGSGPAGIQGSSFGSKERANINVTVTSADPRAVVDALVRYNRQNGAIPVTVGP